MEEQEVWATVNDAIQSYTTAKTNLLNPAHWHELAGVLSGSFKLTDAQGREVERPMAEGDQLKISLPGPKNKSGEGHDWVRVEKLIDLSSGDKDTIAIRLRAAPHPTQSDNTIAHFFDERATSTFLIMRNGKTVRASYYGRNETPNNDTGSISDNLRNTMVATGAMAGLSEAQWSALLKGFLKNGD